MHTTSCPLIRDSPCGEAFPLESHSGCSLLTLGLPLNCDFHGRMYKVDLLYLIKLHRTPDTGKPPGSSNSSLRQCKSRTHPMFYDSNSKRIHKHVRF